MGVKVYQSALQEEIAITGSGFKAGISFNFEPDLKVNFCVFISTCPQLHSHQSVAAVISFKLRLMVCILISLLHLLSRILIKFEKRFLGRY